MAYFNDYASFDRYILSLSNVLRMSGFAVSGTGIVTLNFEFRLPTTQQRRFVNPEYLSSYSVLFYTEVEVDHDQPVRIY